MSSDTSRRRCTRCGNIKPADEFPMRTARGVTRPSPRCRDCIREVDRERQQKYREKRPEGTREANREAQRRASARRVGVSPERAEELRAEACGICGTTPEDGCMIYQDKETGAVLGALCVTCHRGLSILGGTPERLTAALAFVQLGKDLRNAESVQQA